MIPSTNPEESARPGAHPTRQELAAWLRLTQTDGVGPATALTLLRAFGSPDRMLGSNHTAVAGVVGQALATRLLRPDPEIHDAVAASLRWAEMPGHCILTLADPDYPRRLLDLPDPPPVLHVAGETDCLTEPVLAIVGSRHATLGGLDNARSLARALAANGLVIASGLARGIDAAAHDGALEVDAGKTLAVLGTGIDQIYPPANHALASRILTQGALLSEFALGVGPMRSNFPRRNRLIAALSLGVLVVEAAPQSGSLITARLAGDLGREVFAIPGSIHSPQSRGCHQLIRDGARLVESAEDILSELRGPLPRLVKGKNPESPPPDKDITSATRKLLGLLGHDFVSVYSLASALSIAVSELEHQLLQLELEGHIERSPDGRVRQRGGRH